MGKDRNAYARAYYREHKEERKAANRAYHQKNKEEINRKRREARAKKRGSSGYGPRGRSIPKEVKVKKMPLTPNQLAVCAIIKANAAMDAKRIVARQRCSNH